ncbi:hypothetical protein KFU94_03765 [Chloroflexi bacterium TSY]|nr:hypothetical protein [Chloroflexi bacterium TSY]
MKNRDTTLHENLSVIEVTDRSILDTLYADRQAARFLLTRLSDNVALVAPGKLDSLQSRPLKLGHTPKVLQ